MLCLVNLMFYKTGFFSFYRISNGEFTKLPQTSNLLKIVPSFVWYYFGFIKRKFSLKIYQIGFYEDI